MDNIQNQTINFKEVRDFGQVFNITFVFLKQNYKPLFMAIFSFVVPFSLLLGIAQGLLQVDLYSFTDLYNPNNFGFNLSKLLLYYFVIFSLSAVSYAMMFATTYSFISLYVEKGFNNFTSSDVWMRVKQAFLKTLGSYIVVVLLIAVATGVLFFLIGLPGLYLFVSTCFTFIILIYEKKNFGQAFSRSFQLTHKKWWWTLLMLLVVFMMVWVIGMIFNIPNMIISFSIGFNQGGSETIKYIQIGLTIITTIVGVILQVIPLVAVAFHYFSVVEEFEGKGLEQRINMIGKN